MDEFGARLRDKGLRNTPQRRAVLAAVARTPHVTAAEIATVLDADGAVGALSRQGLYNVLDDLVGARLLRPLEPAGSPARFELETHDNHHHLVCRGCGRIQDVPCAIGAAPCLEPGPVPGFRVDQAEVTWWGMCAECEAKA
ncbi:MULTISPECIES: Fur family transcriptional regulator [Amycolatopsis]|uniref:Fur family ferric uptake transcriptional regulator n=1 Tax=Amycolatopsis echigonensis TaxID=2576905 RepID=A0A2N3WMJ3_9PSEU|nr:MULTISPECIES: Fur family transcriptional regulator [Amycolatopsis]MBB2503743.1 transcriptional repressor [Amycolatopsis echigonensis]PKV95087.1 Fur family ferric uptake transcriptional regulator [Amycolatopsis niigatensis]